MATNETLENQTHEAGDESYSNKFNDRNNETIDHLGVEDRDHDGHQSQQQNNCNEKGIESVIVTSNGQSGTMNAIDQSTDTTTTTTTSSSRANSPSQTMHAQHKQDEINENDTAKPCQDIDGDSGTNLDDSRTRISRHVGDNDGQDGDDEDEGDEDLEEGELKDDDDDDDDDDEDDNNTTSRNRFSNSNDNNIPKDALASNESRLHNDPNSQNNLPHYGGAHRPYNQHHNNRRHFSPNQQHHPGMHHPQYPPYQHPFPGSNNNYRFPPGPDGMPPVMMSHMNQPQAIPGDMYGPRGAPLNAGPVQKVNIKCRYYSKTINKCTWGEQCRFRHREDSPSMMNEGFEDHRPPGPGDMGPGPLPSRGPPPPMSGAERFYPTPSMPPQPYGYGPPDEHHPPYGPHQSTSPPLPSYSLPSHHWRQQHGTYPPLSSSAHHPESISPAMLPNPVGSGPPLTPNSSGRIPPSQPSMSSSSTAPAALSPGGASSPGFSSSPSSSAVYERKSRLAYEAAPWNDRGYSQPSRYDRNDPASGYPPPSRGGYYRNNYGRDPYAREPIPHPHHHMGGPPYNYPSGYPQNYPSAYRGPPPGPPYSSHHRYSSSSQRIASSDVRQSKSNKRARDGESSWSDSGSEDSLLNQAGASSKSHSSKISKKHHKTSTQASEDPDIDTPAATIKDDIDQGGSGTPPGEPLPEDKERQELLLEKLREIEDLMAKKK